ncbi:MAG: alpha/beta fold hydrolase, partial [Actinomycetota bacterium]|nr:alpha/beta fold hydrolase [Actinomycetota bacterium]
RPTVLLGHGYPDDHQVWDAVAARLLPRFRVVTWDVRGAGASARPGGRGAYRLDQVADDLARVAAGHSADPVHLIGHDWGSITGWHAVTRAGAPERFASFTSVSGPSLPYAGAWLRHAWRRQPQAALRQVAASSYLGIFQLPHIPERFWRSGLGRRALGASGPAHSVDDAVAGLELYRANLGHGGPPRRCAIPVLVLAPRRDHFVTAPLQLEAPARWTAQLRTAEIDGGHWTFVRRPERLVEPFVEFVDSLV